MNYFLNKETNLTRSEGIYNNENALFYTSEIVFRDLYEP